MSEQEKKITFDDQGEKKQIETQKALSQPHPKLTMVLWIVGLGLADEKDITLR